MSEAAKAPRLDLGKIIKEEFEFSVKMFFAPVMAIVNEIKRRWADVDAEVKRVTPTKRDFLDRADQEQLEKAIKDLKEAHRSRVKDHEEAIAEIQIISDEEAEAATKIDLARAYIDMGDTEGARDILGEVLDEAEIELLQEESIDINKKSA